MKKSGCFMMLLLKTIATSPFPYFPVLYPWIANTFLLVPISLSTPNAMGFTSIKISDRTFAYFSRALSKSPKFVKFFASRFLLALLSFFSSLSPNLGVVAKTSLENLSRSIGTPAIILLVMSSTYICLNNRG